MMVAHGWYWVLAAAGPERKKGSRSSKKKMRGREGRSSAQRWKRTIHFCILFPVGVMPGKMMEEAMGL